MEEATEGAEVMMLEEAGWSRCMKDVEVGSEMAIGRRKGWVTMDKCVVVEL